jgi:hypothetical protein
MNQWLEEFWRDVHASLLVDDCYERGRYDSAIDYTKPPQPPLPEEEAAWAGETLSAKGA